ncbi:MAG: type IV pilus modification PilV family protein [Bacillota bacterium]
MKSAESGFTLVEVLVALGILTLVVAAGFGLVAQTVSLNTQARLRTGALRLAESIIEQRLAGVSPELADPDSPYACSWDEPAGEGGGVDGLQQLVVTVSWEYQGRPQSLQIVTYRAVATGGVNP